MRKPSGCTCAFRSGEMILAQRQRIKRETLKTRRLQHQLQAA
jgi:hypothetical protein